MNVSLSASEDHDIVLKFLVAAYQMKAIEDIIRITRENNIDNLDKPYQDIILKSKDLDTRIPLRALVVISRFGSLCVSDTYITDLLGKLNR